jgi:rubrerythrin
MTQAFVGNPLTQAMERQQKPWIGSGLCMDCYNAKTTREEKEQQFIREAQLREAKDIINTPIVWDCPYCKTVNRGNFCSNCGSPRKRTESAEGVKPFMVGEFKK